MPTGSQRAYVGTYTRRVCKQAGFSTTDEQIVTNRATWPLQKGDLHKCQLRLFILN